MLKMVTMHGDVWWGVWRDDCACTTRCLPYANRTEIVVQTYLGAGCTVGDASARFSLWWVVGREAVARPRSGVNLPISLDVYRVVVELSREVDGEV